MPADDPWQLPDKPEAVGGLVLCPECGGSGYGMVMKGNTFIGCTLNGVPIPDGKHGFASTPCGRCKGEGWVPDAR